MSWIGFQDSSALRTAKPLNSLCKGLTEFGLHLTAFDLNIKHEMPIFKHNKRDKVIFSFDISISASLQMTHSPKETKKHFTEDSWQWQWKLFASMGGNENDSWRVAMVKILLCSPSFDAAGRPDWHQNPQWDTPSLSILLQTSKGRHTKNWEFYPGGLEFSYLPRIHKYRTTVLFAPQL